jgi:hypothetical protein
VRELYRRLTRDGASCFCDIESIGWGANTRHSHLFSLSMFALAAVPRLHSPFNERSIVPMNPRTTTSPTEGALRAATEIETDGSRREATANLIDRETGLRELSEILEEIIAEAGDLIEGRSPELLAEARAALRRSADSVPRQAG